MNAWLTRFRQWRCDHKFAIEDMRMVNPDGDKDRVEWSCAMCGKSFAAHCGLDISPRHGSTFRRYPTTRLTP